jgi:hypothetical protein
VLTIREGAFYMSITAAYTLSGSSATLTNPTYTVSTDDEVGIYATGSAVLTVIDPTITSSAVGSIVSGAGNNQYGTGSGVLADSAAAITVTGGTINTSGEYANGLFATGTGSSITMSDGTITATGLNAHGVDVTYGGSITLADMTITTTGANSSVLATDTGGGTVTVKGGTYLASDTTSSSHSAGIYSTGVITVTDAVVTSYADNGAVVAAGNSVILTGDTVTGGVNGIMAFSGGAPSSTANTVLVDGGTLTAKGGDAILVNGVIATVTLEGGVAVTDSTGYLLVAESSATASLIVNGQTVSGVVQADSTSTINLTIENVSGVSAISESITGSSVVIAANAGEAELARLYEGAFGRTPDAAGFAFQAAAYDANPTTATLATMAGEFLASSEYTAKYSGLSDATFISDVFTNALGRSATASDLAFYETALNDGASHAAVLLWVTQSAEAISKWHSGLITL